MTRLSATDALFVYADSPTTPMNAGLLQILRLPEGYEGDYLGDLKDLIGESLELLPKLKKKLVVDVLGLPSLSAVKDIDLDHHVRRVRIRSGSMDALYRKIGELQHKQMDFGRPLFMFYLIEGMSDGSLILLMKFHHAIADGKTIASIMSLVSDEGLVEAHQSGDEVIDHAGSPGTLSRIPRGVLHDVGRTLKSMPGLLGFGKVMLSADGRAMAQKIQSSPVTRFNKPLSGKSLFAFREWPLDEFNRIRKPAGLTFNDMGLVLVGGALRRYLQEHGELPDQSLVCNIPVAVPPTKGDSGNAVLAMWVQLGTHIEDSAERAAFVREDAGRSKKFTELLVQNASKGMGVQLPSLMTRMISVPLRSDKMLSLSLPPGNVALSNVPLPEKPIHVAGARVEAMFGMPMLPQGMGICFTLSSYAGKVVCGVFCDAKALPDPEKLLSYLDEEFKGMEKKQ